MALPRSTSVLFLGHNLSERRGASFVHAPCVPARVLVDGGSVPPRVSTLPSSFDRSCLGSRFRSPPGSSQQSPAPWLRLAHTATPRCFPIQAKGMSTSLTRLLGVHDRTMLTRNHHLSLPLSGHNPQWLANYPS